MADTIDLSSLDPAGPLTGTEVMPIVQGGQTVRTTSADMAAQLATPASESADKSEAWADTAEDVEVEPGKYSSKHWANKAEDQAALATAAAGSIGTTAYTAVTDTINTRPPLAPTPLVNALVQRYSLLGGTASVAYFNPSNDIPTYTYVQSVWDEAHQPNTLRAGFTAVGVASRPSVDLKVTPAMLAAIGVIPDDTTPPQISIKSGLRIDTAVNQDIQAANGVAGQMYVVLRYNGAGASLEGGMQTGNDVVLTNATTGVLAGYQGVGDALWSTNTGEISFLTAKYKKHRRLGIKLPATYNGKAFSGIIIRLIGRAPGAGATQVDFFDLALIAGTTIDWNKNYNNPAERPDNLARATDITNVNQAMRLKMAYNPPLRPLSYKNAIANRYSLDGSSASKLAVTAAGAYTYNNVYSADMFDTYGEPNILEVAGTSAGALTYVPEFDIIVTPTDLARIGIIPDDTNPPIISVRAAIMLAGLVNETIDTVTGSGFGQVWVGLRYDGVNGTTASGFQAARGDVVMSNNLTGLNGTYLVPSPNPFAAVAGEMLNDTGRFKGYRRLGIPVPATINGKALTHLKIKIYGRATSTGAFKLAVARLAVVPGSYIDPLDSYVDYSDYAPVTGAGGTSVNVLDIQRAQKVGAIGNSYTASHYTPRGKSWLQKLSALTDYNVENFAVSGDTNISNLDRIRSSALTYGNRTWKDYGVTYGLVMNATNDPTYESWDDYLDDNRGMVETLKSTGAIPILASEFQVGVGGQNYFGGDYQRGLQAVAREKGALFCDITPNAQNYDYPTGSRDPELWGVGHPGVRTNELISDPVTRFVNALPRPAESLKIFRKRTSIVVGSLDDLITDSLYDRARVFREIEIGHVCMTAATEKYMDTLATNLGSVAYETINSEYLALQANQAVAFTDYALVDVIVNGTDSNIGTISLVLNDPTVTVYVRDILAAPYEVATRYQKFMVSGTPSVTPGATYTSDDPDLSGTFTVIGMGPGGRLIMSPMDPDRTNEGAGTLTRQSGTGDNSISYTSSRAGYHPDYYTNQGKPEGHWVAVTGDGLGKYTLNDLRGKLQVDRLQFLLYKASGFSLTKCQIEYTGGGFKPQMPRVSNGPRATGAELLAQTLCGTSPQLAGWTVVGSLTPGKAGDDLNATPRGTTGYVTVNNANYLRQAFTYTADNNQSREVEVVVKARRWVSKINSGTYPTGAGITTDTFDWGELRVRLDDGTLLAGVRVPVGLYWKDVIVRLNIPAYSTGKTLQIDTPSGDIQVAGASVKLV